MCFGEHDLAAVLDAVTGGAHDAAERALADDEGEALARLRHREVGGAVDGDHPAALFMPASITWHNLSPSCIRNACRTAASAKMRSQFIMAMFS